MASCRVWLGLIHASQMFCRCVVANDPNARRASAHSRRGQVAQGGGEARRIAVNIALGARIWQLEFVTPKEVTRKWNTPFLLCLKDRKETSDENYNRHPHYSFPRRHSGSS